MRVRAHFITPALLAILVAACGGGSTASKGPDGSVGASAPASAAAGSDAPASTAPEPSSGGTAAGVCDLVTVAELDAIFGLPTITTRVLAGPPDTCDVQSDGAPIAAFVLTLDAPSFVFDAFAGDPDASPVSGIGDKAVYNPTQRLFVVQKGSSLLSISAFARDKTDEELAEFAEEIAKVAAGRM